MNDPDPSDQAKVLGPRKSRWLCRLCCVVVALLLLVAGMELFARYYLGLGDPPLSMDHPTIEYMFRPDRTYHRFGNRVHYNAYSMRSESFRPTQPREKQLRILMMGDSIINGGNLTDQRDLASARLKRRLARRFESQNRRVVVGNISAGSWGPGNLNAYAEQYGLFDPDLVVIVVNSKDWTDTRDFTYPAGRNANYPSESPTLAMQEAATRYLPRYLPRWVPLPWRWLDSSESDEAPIPAPEVSLKTAEQPMRALISTIQQNEAPAVVALHAKRRELGGNWAAGRKRFRQLTRDMDARFVELDAPFEGAVQQGKTVYRDPTHPNAAGQKLLADALEPVVLETLRQSGEVSGP